MKIKYILLALIFLSFKTQSQSIIDEEANVLHYFIKNKKLLPRNSKRLILFPLSTKDIVKNAKTVTDSNYWSILQKYYPNVSSEALIKMVDRAPALSKKMIAGLQNTEFLEKPDSTKKYNYNPIKDNYHTETIYGISNFMYSKDRKTCILYMFFYGYSGTTVEIKKDATGQWNSYRIIGNPMN
jgi:hypothetical protein